MNRIGWRRPSLSLLLIVATEHCHRTAKALRDKRQSGSGVAATSVWRGTLFFIAPNLRRRKRQFGADRSTRMSRRSGVVSHPGKDLAPLKAQVSLIHRVLAAKPCQPRADLPMRLFISSKPLSLLVSNQRRSRGNQRAPKPSCSTFFRAAFNSAGDLGSGSKTLRRR